MARVSLCLFLLGCTLLQYVTAEFGSTGTVISSNTIKSTVDSTTELFDEADDRNGLELLTDYSLFSTVLPLMESLGTQVKTLGTAVTSAVSIGVPNDSGNLDAVFDPIQTAITAMLQFIDGEQATTRTTLTDLLGVDINHLFGDVFGNMKNALNLVKSSMTSLKQELQTAVVLNGRVRLPAGLVATVLSSLNQLRATVYPVQYTIFTTIENISMGDEFLNDLEVLSTELYNSLQDYLNEFTTDLNGLGYATDGEREYLGSEWTDITDGVNAVTTNLATLDEYETFAGGLLSLSSTYTALEAIDDNVEGIFSTYLDTAASYLTQFQAVLIPRSYLSITYMLEVLVAGGKHSRFCFFKFFPRLVNYYSNLVYNVESCFNVELEKLSWLYDVAVALVELILYDLEDLLDNLSVCNESAAPGDCIDRIGPYYVALFAKTDFKVGFFEQITDAEASASINRLGACMFSMKLYNQQRLFTVKDDIVRCRDFGPDDEDLGE